MTVQEAIVAVTFRCNSRCKMCDIWSGEPGPEVGPSYYYHLPPTLRNINLTGGEPTLRDDLPEIVEVIAERCPRARIVLSTHGINTRRILGLLPRLRSHFPRLAFRVSVDGIGETHDLIRGVPGAFKKAMESLDAVRRAGVRDIGVGFTLMRGNEDELLRVHELARRNRWQFTATCVHSSPIFFGEHRDLAPDPQKAVAAFEELRRRQLRGFSPKNWFRAYFTDGLVDRLSGRPRRIQCEALRTFFYLNPAGVVYTCHVLDQPIGRLEEGYDYLLQTHPDEVAGVADCPENCWMTCTVAPMMRRRPARVAAWVARNRIAPK